MAKTVNRLTQENQFKLILAMQAAKEELDRDKLTPRQLAERLSDRLGFSLTAKNVESVAALVGVKFHPKHGNGNVMAGIKARIDNLDADVSVIAGRLAFIEAQLGLVAKAGS